MNATNLHIIACIALIGAAIYWRFQASDGDSIYRRMLPYIITAGLFGAYILYGYFREIFVAYYSGAIYEVDGRARINNIWIATSLILSILPFAALIPMVGRRSSLLIVIGALALIPSAAHFVAFPQIE